jgi:hypothetical protein
MNDRFFMDTHAGATSREVSLQKKRQFEQARAEAKANYAQVQQTNVRIGSYNGWKPRKFNVVGVKSEKKGVRYND